jgi:hypothetical protein
MTKFFSPADNISRLIPQNLQEDAEGIIQFLQAYYEWMETTTIILTEIEGEVVPGSVWECNMGSKFKVVTWNSETGEAVVNRLTRRPTNSQVEVFSVVDENDSTKTGNSALVFSIKDNIGRRLHEFNNSKDFELNLEEFVQDVKDSYFPQLPGDTLSDKRVLARHLKEVSQSKGTLEAYRFLFRVLFDEEIEMAFPGDDILKVSDGKFIQEKILRVQSTDTVFRYLNRTIVGANSGATANVSDLRQFFVGSLPVTELVLTLVNGQFEVNENIYQIDDEANVTQIYGVFSGVNIEDGGSGYSVGDNVTIIGDGTSAIASVSSVEESPISAVKLTKTGHGYKNNVLATVNNDGTGGEGLTIRVKSLANTFSVLYNGEDLEVGTIEDIKITNRGGGYTKIPTITLEDTEVSSLGMLHDRAMALTNHGISYKVGDPLIFDNSESSGDGAAGIVASVYEIGSLIILEDDNDAKIKLEDDSYLYGEDDETFDLLFEDGDALCHENGYDNLKAEDWDVSGPIRRIELTNFGSGYTNDSLPTVTVDNTNGRAAVIEVHNIQGTGAELEVDIQNNVGGLGSVRNIRINSFGVDYTEENTTTSLESSGDGNAIVTPIISALGVTEGNWLNNDGKVSSNKYIQDSNYYQDFSYVIKTGLTIDRYKTLLKELLHPAGMEVFGQINIVNELEARIYRGNAFQPSLELKTYIISFLKAINVTTQTAGPAQFQKEYTNFDGPMEYNSFRYNDTEVEVQFPRYEVEPIPDATIVDILRQMKIQVHPENLDVALLRTLRSDVSNENLVFEDGNQIISELSSPRIALYQSDPISTLANTRIIDWFSTEEGIFDEFILEQLLDRSDVADISRTIEIDQYITAPLPKLRTLTDELRFYEMSIGTIVDLEPYSFITFEDGSNIVHGLEFAIIEPFANTIISEAVYMEGEDEFVLEDGSRLELDWIDYDLINSAFIIDYVDYVEAPNTTDFLVSEAGEFMLNEIGTDKPEIQDLTSGGPEAVGEVDSILLEDESGLVIYERGDSLAPIVDYASDIVLSVESTTIGMFLANTAVIDTMTTEQDYGLAGFTIEDFQNSSIYSLIAEYSSDEKIALENDYGATGDAISQYANTRILDFMTIDRGQERRFLELEQDDIDGVETIFEFISREGQNKILREGQGPDIARFSNYRIIDIYQDGPHVSLNILGQGTLSVAQASNDVIGTGTSFLTEFRTGDFIIIGEEKFIVTNIFTSTQMRINVAPSAEITDALYYKESINTVAA